MSGARKSASNPAKTPWLSGSITRLPLFTPLPKKPTPGWRSSNRAKEPRLRYVAGEAVATRPAGVDRLYRFLAPKSHDAATRAVKAIRKGIKTLVKHPEIGRPVEELPPEFREWVIEFGGGAYVALYHYDGKGSVIPAVRYGWEAGYGG
jgi:plasmid stabilization system protein ParE